MSSPTSAICSSDKVRFLEGSLYLFFSSSKSVSSASLNTPLASAILAPSPEAKASLTFWSGFVKAETSTP